MLIWLHTYILSFDKIIGMQVVKTHEADLFRVWLLVAQELHCVNLRVPRIFYVNQKVPKDCETGESNSMLANI